MCEPAHRQSRLVVLAAPYNPSASRSIRLPTESPAPRTTNESEPKTILCPFVACHPSVSPSADRPRQETRRQVAPHISFSRSSRGRIRKASSPRRSHWNVISCGAYAAVHSVRTNMHARTRFYDHTLIVYCSAVLPPSSHAQRNEWTGAERWRRRLRLRIGIGLHK